VVIRPMWIAELGISRVCRGASSNRWRVRLGQERAGGLQQWECVSFQRRFLRASSINWAFRYFSLQGLAAAAGERAIGKRSPRIPRKHKLRSRKGDFAGGAECGGL
jgi:hypothetical protein